MNVLLDTHILLWTLSDDPRMPSRAKEIIKDEGNRIFYSIVSLWETELKHIAHPDNLDVSAKEAECYCKESGFTCIPLRVDSICLLSTLHRGDDKQPHKDPFDKILICQSLSENMMLLTHDKLIGGYDLPNIVVV